MKIISKFPPLGWVLVLLIVYLGLQSLGLASFTNQYKNTVTVVGYAESGTQNEVASFTATVSALDDDKSAAVANVEAGITKLHGALQKFGIVDADIKTQSINIWQREEQYWDEKDSQNKFRKGQWDVSNSIDIKLRDIKKADALSSLLAESGATNVYGPNFALDDPVTASDNLSDLALQNAMAKAEKLALYSGRRLGEVLGISEVGSSYAPYYAPTVGAGGMGGGGGGMSVGTSTVSKSLNVTFELK